MWFYCSILPKMFFSNIMEVRFVMLTLSTHFKLGSLLLLVKSIKSKHFVFSQMPNNLLFDLIFIIFAKTLEKSSWKLMFLWNFWIKPSEIIRFCGAQSSKIISVRNRNDYCERYGLFWSRCIQSVDAFSWKISNISHIINK